MIIDIMATKTERDIVRQDLLNRTVVFIPCDQRPATAEDIKEVMEQLAATANDPNLTIVCSDWWPPAACRPIDLAELAPAFQPDVLQTEDVLVPTIDIPVKETHMMEIRPTRFKLVDLANASKKKEIWLTDEEDTNIFKALLAAVSQLDKQFL